MFSHRSTIATRLAFFAGGVAATAAVVMLAGARGDSRDSAAPAFIDQEPVLFVDVAGFGIAGPLHSRLAVYSDGTVMVANASNPFDDGSACYIAVDPDAVRALREDLRAAGAFSLSDLAPIGDDIPVTTATVFQPIGGGTSRARTFSYTFASSPGVEEFAAIVQAFRDAYVAPEACSNSG